MIRPRRLRKATKRADGHHKERLVDVPQTIAGLLTPGKIRALRQHFQEFDSDKSGFVDSAELTKLLQALGFNPSKMRIHEILDAYDTDKNGNLCFGEFVEVWAYYCQEAAVESEIVQKAFHFFDQDDSKSLSYSEFASILSQTGDPLSQEEISQFFALVDKDQDGMLNIDEFMQVLYPPDSGTTDDARLLTRFHSMEEIDTAQQAPNKPRGL